MVATTMGRMISLYTIHRISKRLRILIVSAIVILILLIIIDVTGWGRDAVSVSATLSEDTDMARADYLAQYEWEISTVPLEICDVTIPEEFDAVYQRYNDLQQSQGFDLMQYQGKTVKRYTYSILNYPQEISHVRANLLVYNREIIGGDICTAALDGFMHGFERDDNGSALKPFTR